MAWSRHPFRREATLHTQQKRNRLGDDVSAGCMAQPPTPPPSGPPPTGPAPPYGPYPSYPPYPYYAPPPQRDNLVLIIVIVVIVVVVLSIVSAAILYVMVSGLLTGPGGGPRILFGPVDQTGGNATILIIVPSGSIAPGSLRFSLVANGSASPLRDLPPPDGSVAVVAGTYTLRMFWLDNRNDGLLETGDEFLVAGDLAPLPVRTTFEFSLQASDGSFQTTIGWMSN